MRILILSHYFWPEPIPKPLELARALRDEGHTVEVVTGFPNYPGGTLYPGFRLRFLQRDTVFDIPVRRAFMYPDHGTSLIGRMLNYSSFMLSGIVAGLAASPFDVMYVWHPPLSIGVTAAAIGLIRRRGFVYDVQDIWPESAIATGFLRPGRISRWMSVLEKFIYRRASHILVVTDGARQNLIAKGVPDARITIAPHWYDEAEARQSGEGAGTLVRDREGWVGRFVVMFAGNLGVLQGLDTVVRACGALPPHVLVAIVGDGVDRPRLEALARELDVLDRIHFVGRQPASSMADYFAAADALLVHLRDSPLSPLIIPTKTIAYLAAAKPIVMATTGASADIVTQSGAGVVLAPGDPHGLASAIVELAGRSEADRAQMGRKGRLYFERHFTRDATLPTYLRALAGVSDAR